MRVLLLTASPAALRSLQGGATEHASILGVLEDLGCEVRTCRFDLLDRRDMAADAPDILILDVGNMAVHAPALRALKEHPTLSACPKLAVVAHGELGSLDFDLGFDDFVIKPILPAELYARLRLLDWRTASFVSTEVVKIEDLVIDLSCHQVRIGGRKEAFAHLEFELLAFLACNRGRVYSREQLLEKVWGHDYDGGERTVDIHIRRIRAKLGRLKDRIATVRNVGYMME